MRNPKYMNEDGYYTGFPKLASRGGLRVVRCSYKRQDIDENSEYYGIDAYCSAEILTGIHGYFNRKPRLLSSDEWINLERMARKILESYNKNIHEQITKVR